MSQNETWWKRENYPPVMVAIPSVSWMWTKCVEAFIELRDALPPGSVMSILTELTCPAASRNALIERFLRSPQLKYILFLDADMTPPQHTAVRLLSHELDIVGAPCYMRYPPYLPTWEPLKSGFARSGENSVQEVETTGVACLLVGREVIEKLPFPWFESPAPGLGEDSLFCKRVRSLGYKIHLDMDLSVGHMETRPVGREESAEYLNSDRGKEGLSEWFSRPMSRAGTAVQTAYQMREELP